MQNGGGPLAYSAPSTLICAYTFAPLMLPRSSRHNINVCVLMDCNTKLVNWTCIGEMMERARNRKNAPPKV